MVLTFQDVLKSRSLKGCAKPAVRRTLFHLLRIKINFLKASKQYAAREAPSSPEAKSKELR